VAVNNYFYAGVRSFVSAVIVSFYELINTPAAGRLICDGTPDDFKETSCTAPANPDPTSLQWGNIVETVGARLVNFDHAEVPLRTIVSRFTRHVYQGSGKAIALRDR
jgi:hypothetical protein